MDLEAPTDDSSLQRRDGEGGCFSAERGMKDISSSFWYWVVKSNRLAETCTPGCCATFEYSITQIGIVLFRYVSGTVLF